MSKHPLLLVTVILCSLGAAHRTDNFVVEAPTAMIAAQVGERAEHFRNELAKLWLDQPLPQWHTPCPLKVEVSLNPPSGSTTFTFGHDRRGRGQVMGMKMEISGPLDRSFASTLPHEITHTILAHHFRQPVPRWADEGAAVCSEDRPEQDRHHLLMCHFLREKKNIPLRTLLSLKEYPANVHGLYAGGYSICKFLVEAKGRQAFLRFVGDGMKDGWDQAVRRRYPFRDVEEMEQSWHVWMHLNKTTLARIRVLPLAASRLDPGIGCFTQAVTIKYLRLLK